MLANNEPIPRPTTSAPTKKGASAVVARATSTSVRPAITHGHAQGRGGADSAPAHDQGRRRGGAEHDRHDESGDEDVVLVQRLAKKRRRETGEQAHHDETAEHAKGGGRERSAYVDRHVQALHVRRQPAGRRGHRLGQRRDAGRKRHQRAEVDAVDQAQRRGSVLRQPAGHEGADRQSPGRDHGGDERRLALVAAGLELCQGRRRGAGQRAHRQARRKAPHEQPGQALREKEDEGADGREARHQQQGRPAPGAVGEPPQGQQRSQHAGGVGGEDDRHRDVRQAEARLVERIERRGQGAAGHADHEDAGGDPEGDAAGRSRGAMLDAGARVGEIAAGRPMARSRSNAARHATLCFHGDIGRSLQG